MGDEAKELEAASAGSTDVVGELAVVLQDDVAHGVGDVLHLTDAVLVVQVATPAFLAHWLEDLNQALVTLLMKENAELAALARQLGFEKEQLEEQVRSLTLLLERYKPAPSRSRLRHFGAVVRDVLSHSADVVQVGTFVAGFIGGATFGPTSVPPPETVVVVEYPTTARVLGLCELIDDDSRLVDDPAAEAAGSAGDRVRR